MASLDQIGQGEEVCTVGVFLDLIARDIEAGPEALKPISNETFEYMRQLSEARKASSPIPRR